MKIDKKNLPKILSIAIGSILGLVLLFIGFKLFQGVFTKASDSAPREVVITAITQNTAKISWTTDQETQAVIEYGTTPTALNFFSPEAQKGKNHTADLTLLSPNTTYYFQIRVGDQKYDNGGVPWTFLTKGKGSDAGIATPSATVAPTGGQSGIVVPTSIPGVPTMPVIRPTSSLVFNLPPPTGTPVPLPTLSSFVCGSTDCIAICNAIGKTCSSQNWMRSGCVGKVSIVTCTTIVPTTTPTPSPTGAPTATPTVTPTPSPSVTPTPSPSPTPSPTTVPTPT